MDNPRNPGLIGRDDVLAVRYATLAAVEATRRLAHEEAAHHLARALEVLDEPAHGDRRTELLLELASARRRADDLAGSWQACLRRLGDQSERARKTVTARIRDVIDRVERVHPALGAHLRASVTTGTFCSYSPPGPTAWEL